MQILFQIALILVMLFSAIMSFAYPDSTEGTTRAIAMFFATMIALLVVTFL